MVEMRSYLALLGAFTFVLLIPGSGEAIVPPKNCGTITVKHETLHATIRDWCDSFFAHGFRHVLIYSGHGGNAVPLARSTTSCPIG